jgi:hypothetical protein
MSLRLKFLAVLVLGFFSARSIGTALADPPLPQDSCPYSSDCGDGLCKVWNPQKALFACEPKQYTVAVWDRSCIDKIDAGEKAQVEAPVVDGEPDRKHSRLVQAVVTFKKGCSFHYEVRSH